MSGAEALLVVGLAANVLQFLDFTAELCGRIRDYSTGPGLPRKLAAQADRLSDLLVLLRSLSANSINGTLEKSVVARCQAQAEDLVLLLNSLKGSQEGQDRWWSNARKALRSLSRSEKVEELQNVLDSLLSTLSILLQAETRLAFEASICPMFLFAPSLLFNLKQRWSNSCRLIAFRVAILLEKASYK